MDTIIIGKLKIIKRVILRTLGKPLFKFRILKEQVSDLHGGLCGKIRTVLLIVKGVHLIDDLGETFFLFLLNAGRLRLLDLYFRLCFNFRLLVFTGLFLPEFADRDFVSNVKIIPAATNIDLFYEITQKIIPFVQFKVFIRRSLN